jgi:hypothetical protein
MVRAGSRWLIRREFLVTVKDLTGPLPPIVPVPDVSWRRVTAVEIPSLVTYSPTLSAAEASQRLQEGQECWVAWSGQTAAHWRWETRRQTYLPYLSRSVCPLEGDLWVVEVYTHPSQRRRGLYRTGTTMAMHRARAQGYKRLIGLIAAWNTPTHRVAAVELQRRVVGTAGYWTIGRRPVVTGHVRLDEGGRVYVPPPRGGAPSPSTP